MVKSVAQEMKLSACCIKDCEKPVVARGMCQMHYARMKRHGDPTKGASTQLHGKTPEERFWAYTEKSDECWTWIGCDECWTWIGCKDANGYGRLSINNIPVLAHRFSYAINCRGITSDEHLLHSCDNPACVNPEHLTVGDQAANNKDMFAKGRGRPKAQLGEAHGCSKLTEDDVRKIRASVGPSRIIAEQYGVSGRTIREIRTRKKWQHID